MGVSRRLPLSIGRVSDHPKVKFFLPRSFTPGPPLSLTKHGYLVSSRTLPSTLFRVLTPDTSSILQGGYQHPLSRSWQARRHLTKSMFMYPIFITDDPNASVIIPSLPGQRRWGVNKLEEFLGPLVMKGLESVILFGVPLNCRKVRKLIVQM